MQQHQQVPLDIINEIRGKLPPKSLVRFRCISKAWNDITNDHDLARRQLQRSGIIRDPQLLCLVNFHGEKGRPITSKVSRQSIEISTPILHSGFKTSCCNGWHCFSSYLTSYDCPILMHNPLRQETIKLPGFTEKHGCTCYGLGFDESNNLFKLTCLFVSNSTTEFYILRQKQFWEKLELPLELPSNVGNCFYLYCRNLFLNGAIHYVVRGGNEMITILAFDVEKEQFRYINSPCRYRYPRALMELGGLLVVYSFNESNLSYEIDVLKDYTKGEWNGPSRLPVSDESISRMGTVDMDIVNDGGVMGAQVLFYRSFLKRKDTLQFHLVYLAYDSQTGKFIDTVSSQLSCSVDCVDFYGHQLSLVPLNM